MCWRGHRDWEEVCAASWSKSTAGSMMHGGKCNSEVAAIWGAWETANISIMTVYPPWLEPLAGPSGPP